MRSFLTEEHYAEMDPNDPAFDDTLFIHPDEQNLHHGDKLVCRKNTRKVGAVTSRSQQSTEINSQQWVVKPNPKIEL
jgi:hypothetical protein